MANTHTVSFKLNGKAVDVAVEPRELLIHTLRERLAHTGPHIGCETSHCGACTVDVDGMSVKSCTVLTVQCDGADMLTVEGLEQGGVLHALQQAFHEEHGLQCGYCTPGMLTRAYRLLQGEPEPERAGDPLRPVGQPVPLHRLPEHREGGAVGGQEARRCAGRDGLTPPSTTHRRHAMGDLSELQEREDQLQGMGTSLLRKEDARFIRGQGSYVDDIKLPGMLFGAIVRSPYAHARIKSIDKTKALACPGVVAVLTADDLKPVKLHWMPTLGGDVQAVLADKKVCFQMQEVAMVLATDRYAAADGAALVEVDYEELPAIVDPKKAMAPDAPVIREDIADKKEVGHGPRTHPNHIFTWEAGDKAAADAAFAGAAVTVREEILNPRVHPCPLETCGCVASFDKATGYLTVYMTTQAPHLVRTVLAMLSGIAESKIRVIGGDIGGGFGNKVPVYPGLRRRDRRVDRHRRADQVDRVAHRQHLDHRLRARLPRRRRAGRRQGRPHQGRCASPRWPTTARSTRTCRRPSCRPGLFSHLHRLLRHPQRLLPGRRGLHQQGAGRRGLPLLAARDRGGVPDRAHDRRAGAEARHRQGRDPAPQLRARPSSSRTPRRFGWTLDSGNYHAALEKVLKAVDYEGLRREQAAKRADPNCADADGHRHLPPSPRSSAPGRPRCATSSASACSTAARSACIPPAASIARLGTMTQGQGHATTYAQIIATELGLPAERHRGRGRRHRQGAVRRGHLGLALDAGVRRRDGAGRAQDQGQGAARSPRTCSKWARATSNGRSTASRSRATRARPRP